MSVEHWCSRFFREWRNGHVYTEGGSRRRMIDTRRRHHLLVSLKDFRCKGIHNRCRRCPVSIDLSTCYKEGKKRLSSYRPRLCNHPPSTSERTAPLCHSLLLHTNRRHYAVCAAVAYRSPPSSTVALRKTLHQAWVGGGSLLSHVFA